MGSKKACDSGGQQGSPRLSYTASLQSRHFILEQEDGGLRWETSGRGGNGLQVTGDMLEGLGK